MKYTAADWKIGFSLVSEGKHTFSVGEGKFAQDESGNSTGRLSFPLTCQDGEEMGINTFISFDLTKPAGRRSFAMFLAAADVVDKLEKKFNLNPDLSVQQWADKYLDVNNPKSAQVVALAIAQVAGKMVTGIVRHRTYRDKLGIEKTVADVYEFIPPSGLKESVTEFAKEIDEDSW